MVDRLLICLVEQPLNMAMTMRTAGYTQDQIPEVLQRVGEMNLPIR